MCNNCTPAEPLFHRNGSAVSAADAASVRPITKRGRAYSEPKPCGRCGGAGGGEQWRHTGWTCYQCGGNKFIGTRDVKVYTQAELDKLNVAEGKRADKRRVAAEAKAEAARIAADARRDLFTELHGGLIARARRFMDRSPFINSIVAQADAKAELSDNQIVALENAVGKIEAADALLAGSTWIGKTGERLRNIKATVVTSYRMPSMFRYQQSSCMTILHTEDGDILKVASATFGPDKGSEVVFDATVKSHVEYKGAKQTVLTRVATRSCTAPAAKEDA